MMPPAVGQISQGILVGARGHDLYGPLVLDERGGIGPRATAMTAQVT